MPTPSAPRIADRFLAAQVPQETLEVWQDALTKAAQGLNFGDEEDRVTFRGIVFDRTRHARVTLLRGLAAVLGKPVSGTSTREAAARAIADTWMKGRRLLTAAVPTLPKGLANMLRSFAGGAWSITMTPEALTAAQNLEEKGLVQFVERRGRRGQPKGSDVVLTDAGRQLLGLQ